MTNLDKFYSDMNKTLGLHSRGTNANTLAGDLEKTFLAWNKSHGALAENLLAFWNERYGRYMDTEEARITAIERLGSLMALLGGDFDESHNFPEADWDEIKDIVSAEAETMNMDTLTGIMSVIVSRHGG